MHKTKLALLPSAVLLACLALAGCGGGNSPASTAAPLSGTAAVGAALANATVTLKDAAGKTLTTTADANGAYTFADVSGLTAPLMLRATGTAGGVEYKLHSVLATVPAAGVSGVLNVNPATEAGVAQTLGTSPTTVFDAANAGAQIKAIDTAKLADAKAKLAAALAEVLKALGQDAKADLFTTAFAANGQGLDKLLDMMQFEAQAVADGKKDVVITDKSTKVGVTVAADTNVADVKPVAKPSDAALSLDTSTIKAFIDAFNAQAATKPGIESDAMKALFDTDYLDSGRNRADFLADIATNAVGVQILDFVLQGCAADATTSTTTCATQMTGKKSDGTTFLFGNKMKQGTDKKWLAYGNRSLFDFDFKPLVTANYSVVDGVFKESIGSPQIGFNFWFTGKKNSDDSTRIYKSAKLETSLDNGANWATVGKFAVKANCYNNWLPLDITGDTTNCSNTQTVSEDQAALNNAAVLSGTFKYKITGFTNADYTNETGAAAKEYVAPSARQYFTAATGKAALLATTASLTNPADLGTNSVRFTGPLKSLNINTVTKNADNVTIATGNTGWNNNDVTALNGVATIAKANALCQRNSLQAQCDLTYGTSAKITSVYLDSRDSQGRGILKGYSQ